MSLGLFFFFFFIFSVLDLFGFPGGRMSGNMERREEGRKEERKKIGLERRI